MRKIGVMIKVFYKYKKASLASGVRKSVPKELAFVKFNFLTFVRSGFLDLAKFGFLDIAKFDFFYLANFTTVDKFFISLLIPVL